LDGEARRALPDEGKGWQALPQANGGDERDRTVDLRNAIFSLSVAEYLDFLRCAVERRLFRKPVMPQWYVRTTVCP